MLIKSFNVQCYTDVRHFASIVKFMEELGRLESTTSGTMNWVIRLVHYTLVKKYGKVPFDRPSEAIKYLASRGFSLKQLEDRRARRGFTKGQSLTAQLQHEQFEIEELVIPPLEEVDEDTEDLLKRMEKEDLPSFTEEDK
jgi:hypothetical protein